MTLVAAIHVPEKYGSPLAFIDDFGRLSKKASKYSTGGWASDHVVGGIAQRQSGEFAIGPIPQLYRMVRAFTKSRQGMSPCDGSILAQALESLAQGHRDEAI